MTAVDARVAPSSSRGTMPAARPSSGGTDGVASSHRATADFTCLFGDCLDLLPGIPDKSIDLILCDLPYGTTNCRWDTVIPLDRLWAQYRRIAKGAVVLTAQTPFDKVLGCSNLQWLRYEWIWEKTLATGHLNAKRMPLKAHENVLVFYERLPTYNPQITSGHKLKTAVVNRSTQPNDCYNKQCGVMRYSSTERYPRSVMRMKSDKQVLPLHPTQKPVSLMEYIISTYTNPGDTVMDNCMGSGTTGVAAVRTGRRFIGMEMDANYFRIAEDRISKALA